MCRIDGHPAGPPTRSPRLPRSARKKRFFRNRPRASLGRAEKKARPLIDRPADFCIGLPPISAPSWTPRARLRFRAFSAIAPRASLGRAEKKARPLIDRRCRFLHRVTAHFGPFLDARARLRFRAHSDVLEKITC
jgi:hypothetical protein